jgi:DNA-binding beta-propeller fold protein YncE
MANLRSLGLALFGVVSALYGQSSYPPPNDLPNPYRTIRGWAQLPDGRKWGSTAAVQVGPDGQIWTYERCGANNCAESSLDPILEFDPSGKNLSHFGAGLFVEPHGLLVDKDGNVWVTDAMGQAGKGHQVFKFSRSGRILMTLGKAGVAGSGPDTFNQPSAVVVAPNGDIFVSGYGDARISKFSRDGKFIQQWGTPGAAPGQFAGPHALAMDSRGRLFVADRNNNRIQIFHQDGAFIAEWKQFGRPSGIAIDKDDALYVADSESNERAGAYGYNPGCHRGIRIGRAADGKVNAFIPDPDPGSNTSMAEGIAVDGPGNIYGAEVKPGDLKKYVK